MTEEIDIASESILLSILSCFFFSKLSSSLYRSHAGDHTSNGNTTQLKKRVLGLASLERTIARQRSRIHWLQEGDVNTHFFHVHASFRKRRNHIFILMRGEAVVTEQSQMEALATEHYIRFLGEPEQREFSLDPMALGPTS
jgi:hypothetical protein